MFQFPVTALREIQILKLLNHENVVNLIEICRTKGLCVLYLLIKTGGSNLYSVCSTFNFWILNKILICQHFVPLYFFLIGLLSLFYEEGSVCNLYYLFQQLSTTSICQPSTWC
jgi:serine/threonine protein kinase